MCGTVAVFLEVGMYVPQVLQNYRTKSARGLSPWFVLLQSCSSYCTIISAVCLSLPVLSVIAPSCCACVDAVMLYQWWLYRENEPDSAERNDAAKAVQGGERGEVR